LAEKRRVCASDVCRIAVSLCSHARKFSANCGFGCWHEFCFAYSKGICEERAAC